MAILSTAIYTVPDEATAQGFVAMAPGMTEAYRKIPGFLRLIISRDVLDPLTIVTISWWETEEALEAWSRSQAYRDAKKESGGGLRAKIEGGRWRPIGGA